MNPRISISMKNGCFLLIFLFLGCTSSEESLHERLKGQWIGVEIKEIKKDSTKFDPTEPPPPPSLPPLHEELFFYGGDSLDEYSFIDFAENNRAFARDTTFSVKPYNGASYNFKLNEDGQSIQVFDSLAHKWSDFGKIQLKNDTLVLKKDHIVTKYVQPKTLITPHFDEIVLDISPTYDGIEMSAILREDGSVLFYGQRKTNLVGFYEGQLPESLFRSIWFRFKNAKTDFLERKYMSFGTDMAEVTVSFCKNGEIVKSVYDYGEASPEVFVYAYMYAIQRINNYRGFSLLGKRIPQYTDFLYSIKNSTIERSLLNSESFWLWQKLQTAKIVEQSALQNKLNYRFEKRGDWVEVTKKNGDIVDEQVEDYIITLSNGKQYQVKNEAWGDGQFFELKTLQGKSLFLDISTNVLTPYILSRPVEYPYAPMKMKLYE